MPPPGENKIQDDYNAIHIADTPCTDALKEVPGRWRTIRAHGKAVGLPSDDDMVGCASGTSLPSPRVARKHFHCLELIHMKPQCVEDHEQQ